ncbi:MAG: hypothetical protein H7Y38_18550 [Armatimonadetes bacterium]|nr:hypothetical protein [Armatimonadota bacterium]
MNEEQVIELSQRYLDKWKPDGVPIQVATDRAVKHEGNSWYVSVRLTEAVPRQYHYFDALADAEIDTVDTEHLDVMFVPVG